jgi:hypothetical protein
VDEEKPLSLEQFLQLYPWPKECAAGAALDWLWHFDLPCDVQDIWPRLIDTSRLNRAMGLTRMEFVERKGVVHGSARVGGVLQEWIEKPWSWVWCREMVGERVYSRGFLTHLRAIYRLRPVAPGRLAMSVYFGLLPRNVAGRAVLALRKAGIESGLRKAISLMANSTLLRCANPVGTGSAYTIG